MNLGAPNAPGVKVASVFTQRPHQANIMAIQKGKNWSSAWLFFLFNYPVQQVILRDFFPLP
ncbi:hypothetical protein ETR_16847 [Erwinia tracheiphila PSU-1]|nr:hypothetical protein ETR_16847 [Erwinia tracheiphila PSU-1]